MPPRALAIRSAVESDALAMLAIYAPIVKHTAISFELEPPGVDEFVERIRKYGQGWSWFVAEQDGSLVGYAYGSPLRERPAYRWSAETSVYVAPAAYRQEVGTHLYRALLEDLEKSGFCNAYAGIALPNPASVALHEGVGFRHIGTFPSVGFKFGRWHDVAWFHRSLRVIPPEERA